MAKKTATQEITPEDSIVPVYLVPPTAEEIAANEAAQAQLEAEQAAAEQAAADKETAKASATAKLKKLGLTDDEIAALIP